MEEIITTRRLVLSMTRR